MIKESDYNALVALVGAENISYGTLILPYDYLAQDQTPNLNDFKVDETILKIPSTKFFVEDGYMTYYGAMVKMYTENYDRLFAACGYMEVKVNGEVVTVYTPFSAEDNVRSIRYVAQQYKADANSGYADLGETKQGVVDAYALTDEIKLMNYAAYAANNMMNITVWEYPTLDPSNNFDNETNAAIAQGMIDAGVKVVNLSGIGQINMETPSKIEQNRQIIKFFWKHGLKTVGFVEIVSLAENFKANGLPDFSDCEGFIGFIIIDEPKDQDGRFELLADIAIQFETLYAGTGVTYMNNLLPSEAGIFQDEPSFWEQLFGGGSNTLDPDKYHAYVKSYCDKVLSKIVHGERWLSIDSYPILTDGKLQDTFLFDLGILAYYAEEYGATSHIALQASCWGNEGTTKSRVPSQAEMRMQVYAAMAFGIDSISWFTYADKSDGCLKTPYTDAETYANFTAVNQELLRIDEVYKAFKWKGTIIGSKSGTDDYDAYKTVKGEIGAYELTASQTKNLKSITGNSYNYLMGVMQDMHGNEGYVLCNYNSVYNKNRAQNITINFNTNVTEVIIYRNGVAEDPIAVTNKTITVALATGEGVMILPSKIG